jgi:hypothetical protein
VGSQTNASSMCAVASSVRSSLWTWAIRRVLDLLSQEPVIGTLWIVEDRRIRIRG